MPIPDKVQKFIDARMEATEKKAEAKVKDILDISISVNQTQKAQCLRKIQQILKAHGVESNIPVNHEYWQLVTQYRGYE